MIDDTDDLWTTTQAAEHIGAASTASARRTLGRWGVHPVARQPGTGGESLYRADDVRRARAGRPGRGTRTDLKADK